MTKSQLRKYKDSLKATKREDKELLDLHYDNLTQRQRVKVKTKLTIEQDGCCGICGISEKDLKRSLHIDHNHINGHIRGLLCGRCNTMIGFAKDNPYILQSAIEFLLNNR